MPIKVKDHDKCKEWERRRRDRLNDAFKNLAQLLPHYDPAKIPPKIDILEKSTEFVKELRLSNSRLLSKQAENDEKCKLIKELQDEVNKLILRVKQLTILLNKAKITIPTGPAIKTLGSKRLKWSGKIKRDNVENSGVISKPNQNQPKEKLNPVVVSPVKDADFSATLADVAITSQNVSTTSTGSNTPLVPPVNPVATTKSPSSSINSTSTATPSIIIPLKETNSSKPSDTTKPPDSSSASLPTTSSASSTPAPKSVTTTVVSVSLPPLISEPIFTTTTAATPIQFPLQTIFLAPCSLTPAQTSQLLTRITLPPTILPRPLDSHSLQKIPIKQVLKPIPKVIKRRRKRVKKLEIIESKDKPKANIKPGANLSSSVAVATLKESESEKVSEKPINVISTVSSTVEASPQNEKGTSTGEKSISSANREEVSETDNNILKVQGKELIASESEKGQEEKERNEPAQIQNKIIEQQPSKASETENKLLTEKISETTETIPEIGVNGEDAQSESIPVLRIIDDSQSQTGENSNIFSCVIIEEQSAPKSAEKTSKETLDISVIPTVTAQEQPEQLPVEEISTTISESVATTSEIGQTSDKAETTTSTVLVTTPSEKQLDKEVELNQNESVHKEVCMEQAKVREAPVNQPAPVEPMETDSSPTKPSENEMEGQKSNGSKETDLLLPSDDLNKLNFNPLELEASQTASSQVPAPTPTSSSAVAVTTLDEPLISKEMPTPTSDSNNQIAAISLNSESVTIQPPPQAQELEQPSNPSIATIAILAVPENEALSELASTSSSTMTSKPTDEYTSNSVKQISSSSFAREEHVDDRELSTNDNVTTDKISECIARSIDLIDANDSELMELGEPWEDTGGSPKSPISPTQMFLNIFPLLPRESSLNEHQHQQPSQTATTPQKSSIPFPSSSSRSSFFIDAMLPDDHSVNNSNNHGNINEDIEMITSSSNTAQNHQCLALTPPQYSANISHSISSSLPTSTSIPNTSYYWNTASCSVESSMDSFRGGNVLPRSSVFSTAPTPTTATTTQTLSGVSSKSNAQNSHVIVTTTATTTTSSAASSKPTSSESPRKLSKSSSHSKQNSSGLPSYANRSKSSAASTSTTSSLTWTVATTTPSHSFNVSSSQPGTVQSITQLHSSSVAAASGNQSHSHSCSLLDALNPMDASFFRPLINALDSHDFRSLEFPSSTPLPPPPPALPSLIPTKPLYTPQFSSNNPHSSIQNQMSVNYHPPPIVPPDQHPAASIPSSIIHHHHHPHHHSSMFSTTSVPNNEHSATAVINQDVSGSSSRKQHHAHAQHSVSHQTHHQPQLSTHIQPTPNRNESLAVSTSNSKTSSHNQPEKPSRTAAAKQGKVESSRQSRSGKSSRTQPYIVPTSSSACSQAPAPALVSNHRQHQQAPAFVPHQVSHTPYYSNTNINQGHQSSNSTLKLSNASCSKNQHVLFTPNANTPSTSIGIGPTQHNHQQQHHYNSSSHSQPQISSGQAQPTTGKVSETKSQRNKHEERSSANQTQSKSRIYQNLPQQAAASQRTQASSSSSSTPNVAAPQAITGNVSSSATQANQHHSHRNTTPKVVQHHPNQSSSSVNNASQSHPFQFHPPESFQLFPDFGGNMSRQFNTHPPNHTETSTNFNLQPANVNIQPNSVGATPNFAPQRAHPHPYYLPDISSSFENFTMPMIPPTSQQIHSNTPSRQAAAVVGGGSSCNQNSKYMYGATTASTTNANPNQQPSASTANRMPQTQPVAPVQAQTLLQQPSHHHHHHHNIHQEMPYNNHNAPQHQSNSSNHAQPIIHTIPPHSQAPPAQTVPPPVRLNQQHQNQQQQQQPTSSTSSTLSSSSKAKQLQTVNYPPPNTQQQPPQHQQHQIHQHQQQQNVQSQGQQQPQHAPSQTQQQQPNRPSASRTVNWMTDTGYRTTSSTNANTTGSNNVNKQCLQQSGSTNNPFSVSKLVGITPTPAAPAKPHQQQQQQPSNIETSRRDQAQQQQSSSNNASNATRNKSSSSTSVNPATSNNQSNYCAEALIRKNPEWDNFSSSTNSNFSNYPTHHPPASSSSHNTDHFPSYSNLSGSYQYSGSGHHSTAAAATSSSNFSHFGTQAQHFHTPTPHHHQQQQSNYHSSSQHQPQTHSHSIHQHTQQTSQIHYQHHQHHPHQTTHGTSTSSVSNFNLSTIFPEINDKRSSNNNAGGGQGGGGGGGGATGGSNVGRSSGTATGNMNSFNYHHPAFPGTTGNSHQ
ncbi:unnamed protein product [Orchesella dallaii]|uniref:BHLH domain-containing protein n=1 Tax=Orchesella dallaii TaxID=48710 RepID=A0ABP1QHW6_9HEXA